MNSVLKRKIINIVERSENTFFLEQVYSILDRNTLSEGELLEQLSVEEKEKTYQSLKDSEDSSNLIDHDLAMDEIRKNLGWN
ncbi:hypothetical protein [Salegentibacter salegens]|uniref:Uncharacterized protein n=1 Tax=Salegentibacter salegens TaxID=143223 RepID=A0A1M7JWR9_9FLAO|nr:hypothetical protein [Salegentibacter salegens]PRX51970.1 hypothetical protein LY58_00557 [Salegentibacter salegens]SHM57476.1 hypothetical protein SAMN05878281_1147 [Salegentibacter salegens]